LLSANVLKGNSEVEGIVTLLETDTEDCFVVTVDDSDGEETGAVDYLLNAEGGLELD
jgi:hypothetical protein